MVNLQLNICNKELTYIWWIVDHAIFALLNSWKIAIQIWHVAFIYVSIYTCLILWELSSKCNVIFMVEFKWAVEHPHKTPNLQWNNIPIYTLYPIQNVEFYPPLKYFGKVPYFLMFRHKHVIATNMVQSSNNSWACPCYLVQLTHCSYSDWTRGDVPYYMSSSWCLLISAVICWPFPCGYFA
jgi:hypothetical protein